jgi:proline dehydrogenase
MVRVSPPLSSAYEPLIPPIARELAAAFPSPGRSPRRSLENAAIARTADHAALRAALFRFVDVAPACRSGRDRARHLVAFLDDADDAPGLVRTGLRAVRGRGAQQALGLASAAGVRAMAARFIAGSDPDRAAPELAALWRRGQAWSVDLLGEATVTRVEADAYERRCETALVRLAKASARWPARPHLEQDSRGALPRVNLSIKVSALTPEVRPTDPERGLRDALPRVRHLMEVAREVGAHLHLDMESYDSRELIMGLLEDLLRDERFRAGPSVGIVLQAYLRDAEEQLERLLALASANDRAHPLTVRLVKGAYWDHETVDAQQRGWTPPTYALKAETDRCFERITRRLLDAGPGVRVAIASHNLRSVAHAIAYLRAGGGDERDLEVQVLRGLGDELAVATASLGLRTRVYTPVGGLVDGMAYLVRRLLENTSNDSFLSARAHGEDLDRLLVTP